MRLTTSQQWLKAVRSAQMAFLTVFFAGLALGLIFDVMTLLAFSVAVLGSFFVVAAHSGLGSAAMFAAGALSALQIGYFFGLASLFTFADLPSQAPGGHGTRQVGSFSPRFLGRAETRPHASTISKFFAEWAARIVRLRAAFRPSWRRWR
jgi:hypothetical protein